MRKGKLETKASNLE